MAHKYRVKLINEEYIKKYKGDVNNIYLRSSWEKDFFLTFIKHKNVVRISSEEVVISYFNPVKRRFARYFIDFYIEIVDKKGETKKFIIEVKPYKQTQNPKLVCSGKVSRKDIETYVVNIKKWEAAINYAQNKGYEFLLLTENPFNPNKYKIWKWKDIGLPLNSMHINNLSTTEKMEKSNEN